MAVFTANALPFRLTLNVSLASVVRRMSHRLTRDKKLGAVAQQSQEELHNV